MYVEIHDWEKFSQEILYFKIHNVLNLEKNSNQNIKIAGIYTIFKNDICLYVGQSKNIASRLATHLKGKYKTADEIYFWDICELGFDDFHERNSISKKSILDNAEKYLMSLLKPIDNI